MTNLERWRYWMQDIQSPESFIDWGFYSLIAAALQRRVWTGNEGSQLFCNMYIFPVADPGIGKDLVTKQVDACLRHYKYKADEEPSEIKTTDGKKSAFDQPLLFPVASDAITYEALCNSLANSLRFLFRINPDNPTGPKLPYLHSSISFCLPEIGSLFRKHSEDTVRFLLQTYDCGDYRYETKHSGKDFIKNCCVNIFGGTQPSFIRKIFGDALLTEGFASRGIFLFEDKPRFHRLRPAVFSEEQKEERAKILLHLKELSKLFGEVKFSKEIEQYLEVWWNTEAQTNRANTSPKLIPYYARKNITVQKLAMVLHFADNLTMEVTLDECKRAMAILETSEKRMHLALALDAKNPLALVTNNIVMFLKKNGPQSHNELFVKFYEDLPLGKSSLAEVIESLLSMKVIGLINGKYEITKGDKIE